MIQGSTRMRLGVLYAIYLLVIGAVFARMIPHYINTQSQWAVLGLMAAYLILLFSEHRLSQRLPGYHYVYFPLQLALVIFLVLIPSESAPKDYFTNLVLPLSGQAVWNLPDRQARNWVIALSLFCIVIMVAYYRTWDGLSFGLTYVAGILLISILSGLTMRADKARHESQELLSELQAANRKLQEYAAQVEKLAAAEERNRLARELHDSVSQTIFSMTLTAQAASILLERDPARVGGLLEHLQSLSQSALAEMRTLIQHLRPQALTENGLAAALRAMAAERKQQDGLDVDLQVIGERRLPAAVEDGLFRTAQEALNNVVKHARTDCASITLDLHGPSVYLSISDKGAGFLPAAARSAPGHLGLASMEERVRLLGGTFELESSPGSGTRIQVKNIPLDADPVEPDALAAQAEEQGYDD